MRPEDLIPTFTTELLWNSRRKATVGDVSQTRKRDHARFAFETGKCIAGNCDHDHKGEYFSSEAADTDLETLYDMLNEYAAPYCYFGSHPGDSADYGWWLSEDWDSEFIDATHNGAPALRKPFPGEPADRGVSLRVNDLAEVPAWFRGEVAVVNDHGNVTLYVKTCRTLREVWSIV
jgi:hypothetical protein